MKINLQNKFSVKEKINLGLKNLNGISIKSNLDDYIQKVEQINKIDLTEKSLEELKNDIKIIKEKIVSNNKSDLLIETYALINEVIKRFLGMSPYETQILAGIAMFEEAVIQMNTGEGKTIAAVFPVILNALSGNTVHVMTANEYLAKRDSVFLSKIYDFFDLSNGYIEEKITQTEKKQIYNHDVVYLTAKQAGFDYLYDNLIYDKNDCITGRMDCVIIDEADFILIDEVRLPLVISGDETNEYYDPILINKTVLELNLNTDFIIDIGNKKVLLTEKGISEIQKLLKCGGQHENEYILLYQSINVALYANYILKKDIDYIIKKGKILLVDEFTGRIADKRKWSYGIQRALEAKECVKINPEGIIYGSITTQNYINLYKKKSGMTATAISSAEELLDFYKLSVIIIPPYKKNIRIDFLDKIFITEKAKINNLISHIEEIHKTGRPILIGTHSVSESEKIYNLINEKKIKCNVLNAKNYEMEAVLIAKAGMYNAVTISTNMAGRGIDIKLGGEEKIMKEKIIELGGLYVIGTYKHESERLDNQLRGRAGRQGDPGESVFFVSFEDDIIKKYNIEDVLPSQYLDKSIQTAISDLKIYNELNRIQRIIETVNYKIRKILVKYSAIVEKHRIDITYIRKNALYNNIYPDDIIDKTDNKYNELIKIYDCELINKVLLIMFLYSIDNFWKNHLVFIDEFKEGLNLLVYSQKDPLLEFIKITSRNFYITLEQCYNEVINNFNNLTDIDYELSMKEYKKPSCVWTFQLEETFIPDFSIITNAIKNSGKNMLKIYDFLLLIFKLKKK